MVRGELNLLEVFIARVACPLLVALLGVSGAVWSQAESGNSLAEAENAARVGKFDVAAVEYRKLLKAQPQSAELWSNLAAVETMGGHCERAFPALDRAKSLDPRLFTPWYFAGVCNLQFHHDEQALAALGRATELNPRDANAWYLRAQAAANLDRLPVAFQAVLEGLALDPTRPDAYFQAGKIALDLAARCYDRVMAAPTSSPYPHALDGDRDTAQGLVESGIDNYRKGLTLAPGNSGIHFSLSNAYLAAGKLPEAETELRTCLTLLSPTGPHPASHDPEGLPPARTEWVRLRLALVLARQDRPEDARPLLESAKPKQLEAPEEFEDLLASANLLRMPDVAGNALREAVARFPREGGFGAWRAYVAQPPTSEDPKSPSAGSGNPTRVGLGVRFLAVSNPEAGNVLPRIFSSRSQYHKFRAAFLNNDVLASAGMLSVRLEPLPQDPAAAYALGSLLQWFSYRLYERLATDYPKSEAAQQLAAENLSAAGDQAKALEIYQAMLERSGPSPDLLRAIAQILWTEHNWDEALKVLDSLHKLDPRDPTTLVNLGRIYSYQRDLSSAEGSFRQAIEDDPSMFEAHLGLGETLSRRGDEEGALREFKLAAEIQPQNPQPHYALAQAYRKRNRTEVAQQEMATYQRLQAQAALKKTRANRLLVPLD